MILMSKMALFVSFCSFWVLFTLAVGSATPLRDQCEGDSQCMPGYYCFTETKYCASCTDCVVYNRNKSWKTCAKSPSECGTCLSGFEEEILANGRVRDWCVTSPNQASAHHSDAAVQATHNYLMWPLAIGFFVILTIFYAVCWKNWRGGNLNRLTSPNEEPPPYSSLNFPPATQDSSTSSSGESEVPACSCSANASTSRPEESSNPRHMFLNLQQCKEQPLLQAVPFRYPEDSLQRSLNPLLESDDESSSDHESSPEELVGALSQDHRNIDFEDENTMPSDWTPNACRVVNQEEAEEYHDSCDTVDSENTEPPAKKRKEDEPASPEATESQELTSHETDDQ